MLGETLHSHIKSAMILLLDLFEAPCERIVSTGRRTKADWFPHISPRDDRGPPMIGLLLPATYHFIETEAIFILPTASLIEIRA